MRSSMIMALAIAVAAAPACGGDGSGGGSAPLEGQLEYARSGGFAGVMDSLVIESDGRAELTVRGSDPVSFTLSDDELEAVTDALQDADFAEIDADSTSDQAIADAFTYKISYGGKTVRTDDGSIPSELQGLLTELDRLVREHRPG